MQGINWRELENGELEITLPDMDDRVELLVQLYPPDHDELPYDQIDDGNLRAAYAKRKQQMWIDAQLSMGRLPWPPKVRGWRDITEDWLLPILESGFEYHSGDQQMIYACCSADIILFAFHDEETGEIEHIEKAWYSPCVLYREPSGMDTLALTGKCVWAKAPTDNDQEDNDRNEDDDAGQIE